MSTSGPVKLPETANQRELFSYILRTRDAETKKQLVSLLKPEEQKEFIAFYKEAMAKAQEAQRLRAEVERLQGQREAVLNQYGAQAASQLSQVSVSGSSQPKPSVFRK
tara:strand:- start:18315 stop:18638 length:324 start_codon:yes stop_codon:yes gene_type:complete